MKMNQIINMVIRLIMRRGINAGINKGIGMARGRGRNQPQGQPQNQQAQGMSPEERAEFEEFKRQKQQARKRAAHEKRKQNTVNRM